MRSRAPIFASLIGLAAAILILGVAVAGAGQSTTLPEVDAPTLLAGMATADVPAVSGDVSWQNDLFGDIGAASDMAQLPASSPLTSSGSGRIWVSDQGARAESQGGGGGDQIVVVNKEDRTAWVYDSAQNAVTRYAITGEAPSETASPAPSAATFMTPEAISLYLRQLARFATVEVAGQAEVAGRDAYLLRMTPVADDTALGSVQAAVDGETMVPLRLEVFAKGSSTPVLRYGFDSVSYDALDASLFVFTVPDGAKVTTKEIDGDEIHRTLGSSGDREPSTAKKVERAKLAKRAFLTRAEVQELVPYDLAWARGYEARPFRWGFVFVDGLPVTAAGKAAFGPLGMDLDGLVLEGPRSFPAGTEPAKTHKASVLLYGDGFGTIALAQTKTTAELEKQIKQLRQASSLFEKATVDGAEAQVIGTQLGGVIVWQKGGTTLIAAGMVPMADLEAFASSVR